MDWHFSEIDFYVHFSNCSIIMYIYWLPVFILLTSFVIYFTPYLLIRLLTFIQ